MSLRQAWLRLHLWLGLSLGAWFMMMGITGSLLVFYPQLDRALNPHTAVTADCPGPWRWQDVVDALQATQPALHGRWRLELPRTAGTPVYARFHDEVAATRLHAPLLFSVDPCTLQVVQRERWGETTMTWLYDLHYMLLLESAGRELVGWGGLLLIASLASGVVLWWPRQAWWPALRPQWRHGMARRTWDLHTRSGLYAVVVLLVLAVTGTLLAWPERTERWVDVLSPVEAMPAPTARSTAEPTLTVDAALDAAVRALPGAAPRWIDTPAGPTGSYRVRLRQPGEPGDRFPRSYVWIDPYDGTVLALRNARQRSTGDAFMAWLHPLHDGEALGLVGRWLVFFAGLVPTLLGVTGWLRWRQKRRGERSNRSSRVPPQR